MKIVSLLPSATEIVFALGLGDQLEAATDECDFPDEARSKPVVSRSALAQDRPVTAGDIDALVRASMDRREPLYTLDKDLIRKIQPDLILAQDLCRVCAVPAGHVEEALKDLECSAEVVSLDPTTLDEVLDSIAAVGRSTGTEDRAARIIAGLRERVERVRQTAARLPAIRTLCLEWSAPPFVGGHWIPQMVEVAGGTNLLNDVGQRSREVTWREVADCMPEVIVHMPCGYWLEDAEIEAESLFALPDFSGTPAARGGGVFAVDASSYFSRPGPRIVDGLEILAWCIHPEAFAQPPKDAVVPIER